MTENTVIGPMLTAFGFKSWYWVCRPTQLVTIPGGFWVAISAAMPGAYAGLLGGLAEAPGRNKGNKLTSRLLTAMDEELPRYNGAVVYKVEEIASITCKQLVLGTNPDFVIETTAGKKAKFGLGNPLHFDAVFAALQGVYGEKVRKP